MEKRQITRRNIPAVEGYEMKRNRFLQTSSLSLWEVNSTRKERYSESYNFSKNYVYSAYSYATAMSFLLGSINSKSWNWGYLKIF